MHDIQYCTIYNNLIEKPFKTTQLSETGTDPAIPFNVILPNEFSISIKETPEVSLLLIYLYISCEIKARVTRKWYNGFHIDRPRACWPWQTTESESALRLPAQHFSTLNDEKVE